MTRLHVFTITIQLFLVRISSQQLLNDDNSITWRVYGSMDPRYPHFHFFAVGQKLPQTSAVESQSLNEESFRNSHDCQSGTKSNKVKVTSGEVEYSKKFYTFVPPFIFENSKKNPGIPQMKLTDLSIDECESEEVRPLIFKEFDAVVPVNIPGRLNVSLGYTVIKNLVGPIEMELDVYKLVSESQIKIPCHFGFGSCLFYDFCEFWKFSSGCPKSFQEQGIPCNCPFNKGDYFGNDLDLSLLLQRVGVEEASKRYGDGTYVVQVTLRKDNEILSCLHVTFTMVNL